jgi:hypothetical protein
MINIEQITSRLAKMPDQSLQQYAMMHKGDPYIIALAMSESKRRKDMRASAQAGPAQAQPKVVDQELARMGDMGTLNPAQLARLSQLLEARKQSEHGEFTGGGQSQPMAAPQSPDEAGIAALPAGDMNFADGGIVAFADGGGVERYQDQGLVRPYETPYDRMNRETREREAAERAERLARIEAAGGSTSSYGDQMGNVGRFIDQYVPDPRDIVKTLVQAPGYEWGKDKVTAPKAAPTSRPTEIRTPQQLENLPAPKPKPKLEAGLGGTREAAALRGPVGPSVQGAKETAGQFLDTKGMRSDLGKYQTDMATLVEAARARREEGKPAGEAYSKYEESLKKEESGAGKEKDEATGVAIFRLGVGMMAGTSPNAFKNIGDAAGTALTEYSGAIKDMKKAAKERQKAFGEIEQARRAESREDWKTAQAFEDKAEARMDKAREVGIKGIMDITGKDAELSAGIYKTQVEQQGRMDVAQLQARTTLAAAKERGAGGGDKQQLAELKALQGSLATQLKTEFNKDQRAAINAQLTRVNAEIEKMAGLGTMAAAPGAARPGGTSTTGWGKAQVITP